MKALLRATLLALLLSGIVAGILAKTSAAGALPTNRPVCPYSCSVDGK